MRFIIYFVICFFTSVKTFGQPAQPELLIIPKPVELHRGSGHFNLPKQVVIFLPDLPELALTRSFLKDRLSVPTGFHVVLGGQESASIKLLIDPVFNPKLGSEGYHLSVSHSQVIIKANQPAGLFYGVQTLLQLLPKEIESKVSVKHVNWQIPVVEIIDYPKLAWRGLMFDVARHFFTTAEVKQYIVSMSRYKYNVLHLHLTDDEGWRIEIRGFPKLTEVGAWNVRRVGDFGDFIPPKAEEPRDYGGFYTQEDIRELVKFAKDHFIDILPEIDVPGHSLAAIASYPELSCTPEAVRYKVRSGEKIMDWSRGAPPIALLDNTLCPANELVYSFMDTVISQIADLFPFEYIHLGGDEAPINYWQKNEQIKALMQRESIKDIKKVQGYFTKRVEQIVESKGKKMMAWDEVLEGGVSPSTAVMSWRGMKYGIEAAQNGHQVVMSPTTFAYLDYMQADEISEPRVYASLRLSKSYEF